MLLWLAVLFEASQDAWSNSLRAPSGGQPLGQHLLRCPQVQHRRHAPPLLAMSKACLSAPRHRDGEKHDERGGVREKEQEGGRERTRRKEIGYQSSMVERRGQNDAFFPLFLFLSLSSLLFSHVSFSLCLSLALRASLQDQTQVDANRLSQLQQLKHRERERDRQISSLAAAFSLHFWCSSYQHP